MNLSTFFQALHNNIDDDEENGWDDYIMNHWYHGLNPNSGASSSGTTPLAAETATDFPYYSNLPVEVKELIFINMRTSMQNLAAACKQNHEISKSTCVRVRWICSKFGISGSLQGALSFTKLLTVEVLDSLLSMAVIPRYVLQRAFIRFQAANRPDLIIQILKYGVERYGLKDMTINKQDTQLYRDLVSTNFIIVPDNNTLRLERLRTLFEKFHFDPNFCRSSETGIPTIGVNEGYRIFLNAVSISSVSIVRELLRFNVATYVPITENKASRSSIFSPTRHTNVFSVHGHLESIPHWAIAFFPSELRSYLPPTCDALILATTRRNDEILSMLLVHDDDRWDSESGLAVLKSALQLAVDNGYEFGVNQLREYVATSKIRIAKKSNNSSITLQEPELPKKSASALRKLLFDACIDNDLSAVKALVEEGARFEMPSVQNTVGSSPYYALYYPDGYRSDPVPELILHNRVALLNYLIKNYPFDEVRLGDMLVKAIDNHSMFIIRLLLLKKGPTKPQITDKTLKRAIHHNMTEAMPMLIRELRRRNPDKLVKGFSAVLKMATKRFYDGKDPDSFFLEILKNYEAAVIKQGAIEKERRERSAWKGKSREVVKEESVSIERKGKEKSRRKAAVAAAKAIEAFAEDEVEKDDDGGVDESEFIDTQDYDQDMDAVVENEHFSFEYDSDEMRAQFGIDSEDVADDSDFECDPDEEIVSSAVVKDEVDRKRASVKDEEEDEESDSGRHSKRLKRKVK